MSRDLGVQGHALGVQGHLQRLQCWLMFISVERPRKTGKQNKHRCSSFIGTRELQSHFWGHVTLTFKVTCKLPVFAYVFFELRASENLKIKTKIVVLALLE